jgi:hypothetical protein
VINLAKQSIQSAANSADLMGISSAELVQATMTVGEGESDGNVVSTAAATAQFP